MSFNKCYLYLTSHLDIIPIKVEAGVSDIPRDAKTRQLFECFLEACYQF